MADVSDETIQLVANEDHLDSPKNIGTQRSKSSAYSRTQSYSENGQHSDEDHEARNDSESQEAPRIAGEGVFSVIKEDTDTIEMQPLSEHEPDAITNGQRLSVAEMTQSVETTIDNDSTNSPSKSSLRTPPKSEYTDSAWRDLLIDPLFCSRVLLLILGVLLCALSISYSIAQCIDVKLKLISLCPEPKSSEEIWRHSYEAGLAAGNGSEVVMNEESMYGWTNDECYSTNAIEVNTASLWDRNQYSDEWKSANTYSILFAILAVMAFLTVGYHVVSLSIDVMDVVNDRLHCKSEKYKGKSNSGPSGIVMALFNKFRRRYKELHGWIYFKFGSEAAEIILQSFALLTYGGFSILSDDERLALKPNQIYLFTLFISVNAFVVGMLWIMHFWWRRSCGRRLVFKSIIILSDQISDILYTLFPLLSILMDDYNDLTNNSVILGQLVIDKPILFLSTAVPLFVLYGTSIILARDLQSASRNLAFDRWKSITVKDSDENSDELVSFKGSKQEYAQVPDTMNSNDGYHGLERDDIEAKDIPFNQKLAFSVLSMLFVVYSVVLVSLVTVHNTSAEDYCGSFTEKRFYSDSSIFDDNTTLSDTEMDALQSNPELFVWSNCRYKVYPFTNDNQYRCQCRVFEIDWDSDLQFTASQREENLNLTQSKIMNGVMSNWYMLEKMKSTGSDSDNAALDSFSFHSSMTLPFLKVFEWIDSYIASDEYGTVKMESLEYLVIQETFTMKSLPIDLSHSSNLQYVSLHENQLGELPEDMCKSNELRILWIYLEDIGSIPHCIGEMKQLEAIWIDYCPLLVNLPLSIISLPNLIELSLYNNQFDYYGLIEYNLGLNVNPNDTNQSIIIDQWFEANFSFDDNTITYWFSLNPICDDENMGSFPPKLVAFLNLNTTCPLENPCDAEDATYEWEQVCPPRQLGNGVCDRICFSSSCTYDEGDCLQLCFASELANCSIAKLENGLCDEGCSTYCGYHPIGSDFDTNSVYVDGDQCASATTSNQTIDTLACKIASQSSPYLDANVLAMYPTFPYRDVTICFGRGEINDGYCNDMCRVEPCLYDIDDCDSGEGCGGDSNCFFVYNFGWLRFVENGKYEISHEDFCTEENWEMIVTALNYDATTAVSFPYWDAPEDCLTLGSLVDFNNDSYMNFREFTVAALYLYGADAGGRIFAANCSACIGGMEYYNIVHQ